MSTSYFHKEFEYAKEVIRQAGEISLTHFDTGLEKIIKDDNTIVTEADKAVEEFIRASFAKKFPMHGFVGEETQADQRDSSWIVDPIDGTVAYFRGIKEFANVIAFQSEGAVQFALIYRPYNRDLFSSYLGGGAYLNETKIHASTVNTLHDAIISLDSGNMFRGHYHDAIMDVVNNYRVRVGHSAAVESSYVASGKVDVLLKFNQPIWDVASEWLLMKEAGVSIYNEAGNDVVLHFSKEARHNYIATTNSISKKEIESLFLQ